MKWWLRHHFSWNGGSVIIWHEMVAQSSFLMKWWLSYHFSWNDGSFIMPHEMVAQLSFLRVQLFKHSPINGKWCLFSWKVIHKFFLNLGGYVPALPILIRKATHFINQSLFSPLQKPYCAPNAPSPCTTSPSSLTVTTTETKTIIHVSDIHLMRINLVRGEKHERKLSSRRRIRLIEGIVNSRRLESDLERDFAAAVYLLSVWGPPYLHCHTVDFKARENYRGERDLSPYL